MINNKMTVSYLRISDDDNIKEISHSKSINNQSYLIKEYANKNGFSIDQEYIDDGYSGINFERPGFLQLKQDIENEKISTIITKDISRLGREFIETAYYISTYFPDNQIRFIAINDKFDSYEEENPFKDVIVGIRSIINDNYIKDTSIKRKQVANSKTENKEFIGFMAPYGYKITIINHKRTLEIDEYAAKIVKKIFTKIASGMSRTEVATELNKEKITPPFVYLKMTPSKNKKYFYDWSDKCVYRILKNITYTGRLIVRKTVKNDYRLSKRTIIPCNLQQTIDNSHPAIISDQLYFIANSKLRKIKKNDTYKQGIIFEGLVICGECGRMMTACRVTKNRDIFKYYFACAKIIEREKCKNRVIYNTKIQAIVKETISNLIENFINPSYIKNMVLKSIVQKKRHELHISNIVDAIEFHNNNIKNLYVKKTSSIITEEEFIIQKQHEKSLITELEKDLNNLFNERSSKKNDFEVSNYYNKFINNDIFTKDYISQIIKKIIIYKDNTIKLVFKFNINN